MQMVTAAGATQPPALWHFNNYIVTESRRLHHPSQPIAASTPPALADTDDFWHWRISAAKLDTQITRAHKQRTREADGHTLMNMADSGHPQYGECPRNAASRVASEPNPFPPNLPVPQMPMGECVRFQIGCQKLLRLLPV